MFYLNRNWRKQNITYDLDHLHPYTRFDRDIPLNVSAEDGVKWRQNRNKLPNLWPLVGRDNGSKNDMPLIDYYRDMTNEQQEKFIEQAMIPKNVPLDIQHFGEFYEARKEILRKKLIELLGGKVH